MGISVADNFSYLGGKPLDGRIQYATLAAMKAMADATLYEGCEAYCVETDKYYKWKSTNTVDADTGKWREVSSGGGGGGGGGILYDDTGNTHVIGTYIDSNGDSHDLYRILSAVDISAGHLVTGTPFTSSGQASNPPSNLFDGNTNTFWNPDPSAGQVPCYAGLSNVNAFNNLIKARVYLKTRGNDQEDYWVIEGSVDGTNWEEISERKSTITSGWNEFSGISSDTAYTNIRLYISNTIIPSTSAGRYSQIGEIEFYVVPFICSKLLTSQQTIDGNYLVDYVVS